MILLATSIFTFVAIEPNWESYNIEVPSESSDFNTMPSYHFPMVNDIIRNNAYYEALKLAITKKKETQKDVMVMDAGAGFMLLSMMAAELGFIL